MPAWTDIIRFSLLFGSFLSGLGAFAQTLTTIHDFGVSDGHTPQSGVIFDQAGNLYSTTAFGGQTGDGTVFELTPPGNGNELWTESLLYTFTGQPDGATPEVSLVMPAPGKIVGTTLDGGANNKGSVFEVTRTGNNGPWRERVLYSFGGAPDDGELPNAALLPAHPGLYGVTQIGGVHGSGTIFLLTAPANEGDEWTETTLYSFGGAGDAADPSSDLIMDKAGNLYGTALEGGAKNLGAVYQLSPPVIEGGTWTEAVIFSFSGPDGFWPSGRLLLGQNGELFGTTYLGGSLQAGTVFQLTPPSQSGATWSESVLYNFTGGDDGGNPIAGVMHGSMGRLFGTTSTGGSGQSGVIFRLDPPANDGDPWTELVVASFDGSNGYHPVGSLCRRGNAIYGATEAGGLNGFGTVFMCTR